jgi:uncharacterized protein
MSYRGYNGSTGTPSEKANVADARLAYDHLRSLGIPPELIIVYGESIGTGVASQIAAEKPVGALILDSPYVSMSEVAAHHYPFVPVNLLLRDRYETGRYIRKVTAPVLVLHGEQDDVIPVEMGRRVYEAASEPKSLLTFPEGGHIDHWQFGSYEKIFAWLRKISARAKP